ncbi:MAG: hypothetical protein ACRD07_11320 [Acidimicrobiales bacterium]
MRATADGCVVAGRLLRLQASGNVAVGAQPTVERRTVAGDFGRGVTCRTLAAITPVSSWGSETGSTASSTRC